jgi:dTMP kinase
MKRFESYGVGIPNVDPTELTGWLIVIEGTDGVGRTTQMDLLRAHLERQGYAVADTGLSRSDLASAGIDQAKDGNTLGPEAFNLFYATDFADRLEHQIIPALRSGFVMLTDRYIYSLIARALVRGADAEWIKSVFSFALRPSATFYLRIEVDDLVPRVVQTGGFDYWESGMDLDLGDDLYDSFIEYQSRLIRQLDTLATEYDFHTIDATRPVADISSYLCEKVSGMLSQRRADLEIVGPSIDTANISPGVAPPADDPRRRP